MESESIVYGCIRDWPGDSMERRMRRAANRRVLDSLPGGEAWPFLGREMFSCSAARNLARICAINDAP
ncbi:TPA: hypothetical protein L5994_03930 [Pseudomonas aeruginosa]|nr:hypothetical protein [Pseudomonas aeruginosa]